MKRTKQYSRNPRERDVDAEGGSFFDKPKVVEPELIWDQHVAGEADDKFVPYSLKTAYQKAALLLHPVFGKGIVTAVDGKRIEVLFKDGKKKLGHAA